MMNWIPGTTRSGVGEKEADGKSPGEIDMYDLVRAALGQRPNYIIVGEVRGKETYIMFQAMATGHTTYSTMHADSVQVHGQPAGEPAHQLSQDPADRAAQRHHPVPGEGRHRTWPEG